MSVCLSAREAYFDNLIKVEWPKLLPCQVTLFLFVFNKYFMGGYFEAMLALHSSSTFHSLVFACIVFFSELVITVLVTKWLFSNFIIYCTEKSFLFTYLCQ